MLISVQELTQGDNIRLDTDTELVASIQENGIKVPLCIYKKEGLWVVKDGHRRLAAALVIGLDKVPYTEVDPPLDEADAVVEQVVINSARKGLSYLDVARAYQSLKSCGWQQTKIAERFHVPAADVSLALAALRAHPSVQKALDEGKLAPSAVEPLLPLTWEDQERLIPAAVSAGTVRKVRDLVNTDRKEVKTKAKEAVVAEEVDPMEMLTIQTIEEAARNLEAVQDTEITNPELRRRGRLTVHQLRLAAQRLEKTMNTEEFA